MELKDVSTRWNSEVAVYFEQLSLSICATSKADDFGEFCVCGKARGFEWFSLLQDRLNAKMYLNSFKMYHGKIDCRL